MLFAFFLTTRHGYKHETHPTKYRMMTMYTGLLKGPTRELLIVAAGKVLAFPRQIVQPVVRREQGYCAGNVQAVVAHRAAPKEKRSSRRSSSTFVS
jgi:hypothetical protein